jgi:hypothetical protein
MAIDLATMPPEKRRQRIVFYCREIEALVRAQAPNLNEAELGEHVLRVKCAVWQTALTSSMHHPVQWGTHER